MADGAISYYIDHFVQTRVSKLTYGSKSTVIYDPSKAEHRKRPTFRCVSGAQHIDGVFWVLLSGVSYAFVLISGKKKTRLLTPFKCKNQQVPETNEISRKFHYDFGKLADISPFKSPVYCYRGIISNSSFMDTNPGKINKKEHYRHNLNINSSRVHPSF